MSEVCGNFGGCGTLLVCSILKGFPVVPYTSCIYRGYYCVLPLVNTDRTELVMHESLLSAGRTAPGICVVLPAAWPTRCFGRTELRREDNKCCEGNVSKWA